MPTVFIKTYGCQMNQLDSELAGGILSEKNMRLIRDERQADVILINTCVVRDQAERKALGKLGLLIQERRRRPGLILGIMGCLAQAEGAALLERFPGLDLVCGTRQLHRIGELVEEARRGRRAWLAEETPWPEHAILPRIRKKRIKAWTWIMRGCDNRCSYCIVPFVRGPEQSRKERDVLDEVRRLVDEGCLEVTLLGQNVNSYRGGRDHPCDFVDLLEKVNAISGLQRIRFLTSHPKDVDARLSSAIGGLEKVCEHLHFPVQSGSSSVLRRMNRGYTREAYQRQVDALRERVRDVSVTTDIIVGFPGETEREFAQTEELMRRVRFDSAFVFRFSPRRGTPAASMAGQLPDRIVRERHQRLLSVQEKISLEKNRGRIGHREEILIEGPSKRNPDRLAGRTRGNRIAVCRRGAAREGTILHATITDASSLCLFVEPRVSDGMARCGAGR